MMRQIGEEMQAATSAIRIQAERPLVLDVCAAPGGFVSIALDHNPTAVVYAMTLPKQLGGHPLLISHGNRNPQVNVRFLDITKLGLEYGLRLEELERDMSAEQPYPNLQCDLVFCDGQILRTNEAHRDPSREKHAATRLTCSQLILAMNRMKQGGTLIMLLHKAEAWNTMELLVMFAEFSDLQVFKPFKKHATRSSFYLVARNVQPGCAAARLAVEKWKLSWRYASIGPGPSASPTENADGKEQEAVSRVLQTFGEQFVQLLDPIWDIQRAAIERAPWFKASTIKSELST